MRKTIPENGYESPRIPDEDMFGPGIRGGEMGSVEWGKSSDGRNKIESPASRAQLNTEVIDALCRSDEEGEKKTKTPLRDRVGCLNWTWFTMTMATGGIANVLHSSNAVRICCKRNSALILHSPIPLRLA